jgi:hypothetical protein
VLSDQDKLILTIEGRRYLNAGRKDVAIREELGLSSVRYYQVLNRLLDDPAAVAYAPLTVNRLRRLRHSRARAA